jgi:L-lactate dehydrogenase complex protein LldG
VPDNPARAEILGRISRALADRPTPAPVRRDYQRTRDYADVVELFVERAADYQAEVRRLGASELPAAITAAVGQRSALAVPEDLPASWRVTGVDWRIDSPRQPLSVAELDGVPGVLTGCAVAIAETGTIVLDAGAAQGRRALTLVPDYHLCVVFAGQIAGTVPEAVARLDGTRPLTFISGPSATSDIELSRVEGVHGPRTLHILVVDGTAPEGT